MTTLPLTKMGNVTTQIGTSVVNDMQSSINDISAKAVASSTKVSVNRNNINFQVGGTINTTTEDKNGSKVIVVQTCGGSNDGIQVGPININQSNQQQIKLTTDTTSTVATNIKNDLGTSIAQSLSSNSTQQNQWLSIALNVNTSDQTAVANAVKSIVSKIDTQTSTSCQGFVYNENTLQSLICNSVPDGINIDQNNATTIASSCGAKLVLNVVANNKELSKNIQSAEEWAKQQNSGLEAIIEDVLIVFAVIIVIIIVMSLLLWFFRPKPNKVKDAQQQQQYSPPQEPQYGPPQQYGPPPQ